MDLLSIIKRKCYMYVYLLRIQSWNELWAWCFLRGTFLFSSPSITISISRIQLKYTLKLFAKASRLCKLHAYYSKIYYVVHRTSSASVGALHNIAASLISISKLAISPRSREDAFRVTCLIWLTNFMQGTSARVYIHRPPILMIRT